MEAKKRMSNKAFGRLWYTLLALLLIATLVANYFAMKYTTIITRSLGHTTTKVITTTDSAGDSQYFKSDYASHDELVAHQIMSCRWRAGKRSASSGSALQSSCTAAWVQVQLIHPSA